MIDIEAGILKFQNKNMSSQQMADVLYAAEQQLGLEKDDVVLGFTYCVLDFTDPRQCRIVANRIKSKANDAEMQRMKECWEDWFLKAQKQVGKQLSHEAKTHFDDVGG